MEKWKCIIVDDIEIDRLTVFSFVKECSFLEVVGVFSSSKDALEALSKGGIDVVFLDIEMPHFSGIDIRKKALEVPVCVFITSHAEFALEGFELEALDYIVKPLTFERFTLSLQRIHSYLEITSKAHLFESTLGADYIYIKEGHAQTKLKFSDILYLEALKNYTLLVTNQKKHRILRNLGNLLLEIDFQSFVRVHRGFAIQKHFIKKIHATDIELINGATIPIGRSYKSQLKQHL
ncbi:response regulator transcription factor [Flavobacterium sp. CYK-4]|uniref:LytR/AlgR family response regulator transcription factor n=1 Tax=Flavobacterium lotistagni TaxID=2709660 RepID=UPI00140B67FE|nr:LytTR family DNA-binding domain-containing protein [Flavobacterium lotistagni]NHM06727.1 response regulator transcription factor [Flavobacterium lotistagni]